MEGPFYVDDPVLMRSDIREDREGLPLEVVLRIVEADGCTPIAGAAVDLWHCDALGFYSHYTAYDPNVWPSGRANPSDNETFLRGRQVSDEAGMVRFQTIYPGWYTPRVQHIHARIVLEQKVAATVQLYFPEKLNRAVALRKPYNQRPPSPYNNLNDFVISQSKGGDGSWAQDDRNGRRLPRFTDRGRQGLRRRRASGAVPDRRRPGPLLDGRRHVPARLDALSQGIPGRPAAGRVL